MDISKKANDFDIKNELLQNATILYLEDEDTIREETAGIFTGFFKRVIAAVNGQEGYDLYQENRDEIDIILTDINMPVMNGMDFIRKIRSENWDIPILVITAFTDSHILIDAIKENVTNYIVKPMKLNTTLKIMTTILYDMENHKLIAQQQRELEQFKDLLDNQNLVSESDLEGNIIYVNDGLCEISGYDREELMGKSHSIFRHPDTSIKFFQELWETIKMGNVWRGRMKNLAKDGSTYYTKMTILPIFDQDENIIKYMSARILVTDEEVEKNKLKKFILSQKSDSIKKEKEFKDNVAKEVEASLKAFQGNEAARVNQLTNFIKELQEELARVRNIKDGHAKHVTKLEDQIKEATSRCDKIQKVYQDKINQLQEAGKLAMEQYNKAKLKLAPTQDRLVIAQQNITRQQEQLEKMKKKIEDLTDVIRAHESTIRDLKKV